MTRMFLFRGQPVCKSLIIMFQQQSTACHIGAIWKEGVYKSNASWEHKLGSFYLHLLSLAEKKHSKDNNIIHKDAFV